VREISRLEDAAGANSWVVMRAIGGGP